jgi:hypothetical protein
MVVPLLSWVMSSAGGGRGGHAVTIGDVADSCGEQSGCPLVVRWPPGKGQDIGARHVLAGSRDLLVLVGVLLAAAI